MACTAFAKSFAAWSSSSLLALAVLGACGQTPSEVLQPSALTELPELVEPAPVLPESCDELLALASGDDHAAALMPVLCPAQSLDAVAARRALLASDSADAARRRTPLLAGHPELEALAKLVAQVEVDLEIDARLPDPATAIVTPLSDSVLATAALARARLRTPGLGPDAHTRARAYLAKVHTHALRQLGIETTRPPGPLGRQLAALAIHHGRSFCTAYWRRRVPGLGTLFNETERSILGAVLVLEADSSAGDSPLVAYELSMGRQYIERPDVHARLLKAFERDLGPLSPNRVEPVAKTIPRLLEHGLVDLAIARALTLRKRGNVPLADIEQLLRTGLTDAEGEEYLERLDARLARARKKGAPPTAASLDHAPDPDWASASAVAREQLEAIESASSAFARRFAMGRAVLVFRARPDALRVALDRAATSTHPAVATAVPLLRSVMDELDDGRLGWLRRQSRTDALVVTDAEAATRRRFAVMAREAGDAAR